MKKVAFALILTLVTPFAAAAGNSMGPVTQLLVSRYGKLFFMAGTTQSNPTCSSGQWAVDLVGTDGAAGKAILAAVLAAQASGRNVYVIGKGVCDVWDGRETVEYVIIE